MRRAICFSAGMMLLVVSVCGLVHGARAGLANALYFQAKYGSAKDDPVRVLDLCDEAHGLYPFNYNFCILAAETAYYKSLTPGHDEAVRRRILAERWCGTGLKLNFHKSQLRLLNTRLLVMDSVPEAIAYWRNYVQWQFWAPQNHAVLIELYCLAGEYDKALKELELIKGFACYDEAHRKLQEAWGRETMLSPDVLKAAKSL